MSTASEFRDHLTAFSELYASLGMFSFHSPSFPLNCMHPSLSILPLFLMTFLLILIFCWSVSFPASASHDCNFNAIPLPLFTIGPPNPDSLPEDGKLKSEVMVKENRRYYLDLKENNRGRFLRVRFVIVITFHESYSDHEFYSDHELITDPIATSYCLHWSRFLKPFQEVAHDPK